MNVLRLGLVYACVARSDSACGNDWNIGGEVMTLFVVGDSDFDVCRIDLDVF